MCITIFLGDEVKGEREPLHFVPVGFMDQKILWHKKYVFPSKSCWIRIQKQGISTGNQIEYSMNAKAHMESFPGKSSLYDTCVDAWVSQRNIFVKPPPRLDGATSNGCETSDRNFEAHFTSCGVKKCALKNPTNAIFVFFPIRMGKAKSGRGQNLETFFGLISRVIHPMQGKKSW